MKKAKNWLLGLITLELMLVFPVITHAIPGAKVLITDNPGHKVFEIDPVTLNNIVWEYGTGIPGSGTGQLNYPNEAIPLTNGNILIADTYNNRVIEVDSDTKAIVWQYTPEGQTTFRPVDIKRCKDYLGGAPQDTLLITDFGGGGTSRITEITYPGKALVWELSAIGIGGTGDYLFWEAEKRPGTGTPTYLITCRSNTRKESVIEVQRTGPSSGAITWQYGGLSDPRDANWTLDGNVLITDPDSHRVIEVDDNGTIVWQYGPYGGYIPLEAIRIENLNTLIAGIAPNTWSWDDDKDGKYPPQGGGHNYTDIREIQGTSTLVWSYMRWGTGTTYGTGSESAFVDIEEKGIINIAKIEYNDTKEREMSPVFAGVVVPIFQPEIVWIGTPIIVATKMVNPRGPQKPGATLTYTISLTNTGNGTATDIVVTDQIPDGTKYIPGSILASGFSSSVTLQWSHDGGITYDNIDTTIPVTHVRCLIPTMVPTESGQIGFAVLIE